MGTIAEKLAYTSNAVANIRSATKEKNPAFIEDCPLADVAQAIRDISGGGGGSSFNWNRTLLGTYNSTATTTYTMNLSESAKHFDLIVVTLYANDEDYIKSYNNMIVLYVGTPENLKNVSVNTFHTSSTSRIAVVYTLNLVNENTLTLKKDQTTSKTYYVYGISRKNVAPDTLVAYYESDTKVDNTNQSYHRSEFPLVNDDGTISYDSSTKEFIVNKSCSLLVWGLVGQIGGASNTRGNTKMYVNDVEVGNTDSYWSNEPAKIVYTGSFNVGDRVRVFNNSASWNTIASMMFYRVANVPQAAMLTDVEE